MSVCIPFKLEFPKMVYMQSLTGNTITSVISIYHGFRVYRVEGINRILRNKHIVWMQLHGSCEL